jgi:hypothetical protein
VPGETDWCQHRPLLVNTAVCRKVKPLLRHYSPSLLKMRSAGTSAAAISLLAGILALQKCVYGGMVVEAGMTPVVCHSLTEVHAERSRQREEKITVEDKEDMSINEQGRGISHVHKVSVGVGLTAYAYKVHTLITR